MVDLEGAGTKKLKKNGSMGSTEKSHNFIEFTWSMTIVIRKLKALDEHSCKNSINLLIHPSLCLVLEIQERTCQFSVNDKGLFEET